MVYHIHWTVQRAKETYDGSTWTVFTQQLCGSRRREWAAQVTWRSAWCRCRPSHERAPSPPPCRCTEPRHRNKSAHLWCATTSRRRRAATATCHLTCSRRNMLYAHTITQVGQQKPFKSVVIFFAQLTADLPYTLKCAALSPSKLPLLMGDLGTYQIHDCLGPSEPITWTASRSVQPFLHSSLQGVPILYNGPRFLLKIAASHGGSGYPSSTWFFGPTWVLNPNVISISSVIFAGLTTVTDRLTDRHTDHTTRSVTLGCIYICSTAMWPKNNKLSITNTEIKLRYASVTGCINVVTLMYYRSICYV